MLKCTAVSTRQPAPARWVGVRKAVTPFRKNTLWPGIPFSPHKDRQNNGFGFVYCTTHILRNAAMPGPLTPRHKCNTNARCAAMTIRPYTPRNSARSVGAADCSTYVADGWARAWRKTKRCHAHPIAQPGGEHLPRQSTPIMCVQPGSVRVVCTRVRARVEPGATTGAREYTGSSSLTFPAPAHNHAELSGGNRHSAHRGAKRADVLGVTHRLPPLALDLCTGAASVLARRRSPVSAADPTARGVAASRARVKKKGQNYHFFPYT